MHSWASNKDTRIDADDSGDMDIGEIHSELSRLGIKNIPNTDLKKLIEGKRRMMSCGKIKAESTADKQCLAKADAGGYRLSFASFESMSEDLAAGKS